MRQLREVKSAIFTCRWKKKNNNCVMGKKIVKIDKNIKETDPSR